VETIKDADQLSSILKALKKLETEQARQDMVRSLSKTVHLQKANSGKPRSFSWIIKGSGVIVLSAMLGAGGVIGLSRVMKKDAKIAVGEVSEKSEAPVAVSINSDMPVKKNNPLEKEGVKAVKPEGSVKKQAPPPGPMILPNVPAAKLHEPDDTTAILSRKNSVSKKEKNEAGAAHQPEPASPRVSSVSGSKEEEIKILQDSDLKLMAIAWSAVPADRIAVINGRIIREGESIDGVFVSRINENEVILQKKDELVKLIFRVQ
jgi:hypothetical protein